jgi:branched-chain amino acid transport system substrate-binding protein
VSPRPSPWRVLVALCAALGASCTGVDGADPPTPSPVTVKIAYLADLSLDDASQLVSPGQFGLELALNEAGERGDLPVAPEVVPMNTDGDEATAVDAAHEIARDPSYVATVIGPFWSEPPAVGDALDAAGVPTLSLSALDPALSSRGWSSWRRMVADQARQAESLGAAIRGDQQARRGVCLLGDGTQFARELAGLLSPELADLGSDSLTATPDDLDATVGSVRATGCGVVAWTGSAELVPSFLAAMEHAGLGRIDVIGSDALKDDSFLAEADGAADGLVVTCPCVDLTGSTSLEAQRFIHDYQSGFGSSPGVYAAESWDAAGMLAATFRTGATDRTAVREALAGMSTYHGLANDYRFTAEGELAGRSAVVSSFRAAGLRWLAVGGAKGGSALPVRTRGYLAVASCDAGRPFVFIRRRRLAGFDVELAAAVARRLGLSLTWSDLGCRAALDAVRSGSIDAVLAPTSVIESGAPVTRIALGLRVALVTRRTLASRDVLGALDAADAVGVIGDPVVDSWAAQTLGGGHGRIVREAARAGAYRDLGRGTLVALADLEYRAWAAIERRPALRVAQTFDVGADDVFVASGPGTRLLGAIDAALGRLIQTGRYGLLFATYFPGTPIPPETGT